MTASQARALISMGTGDTHLLVAKAPFTDEFKNHLLSPTVSSMMAKRLGHGASVLSSNPASSFNLLFNLG